MISPHHIDLIKGTDWDDRFIHYALVSVALIIGSTAKAGVEWIGQRIWKKGVKKVHLSIKEHEEFEAWKKAKAEKE